MNGQTVIVRKILPASREEVFDAWLDPQWMSQWMCPGPVTSAEVSLEPREGGRFRIVMHAPDITYISTGEFRKLHRPSTLQFTWTSNRFRNEETFVTVELHECGADCELVLTHERVPLEHSERELYGGWNQMIEKLSNLLSNRT